MKYVTYIVAVALFGLSSASANQNPCVELQVSVRDAEQGNSLPGASVLDLITDELVVTDSNGLASFSQAYAAGTTTTLQILAPGYPDGFKEVFIPGPLPPSGCAGPLGFSITIDLSSDKTYLSPPIGPAGGERVMFHPTGQLLYDDETFTGQPTEYLQRYKVTVPPGALSGQFRLGLTPFLASSFNNAFFDSISSNDIRPIAQFRLGLFDLNGDPVASPNFDPPIRIEVSSATVEPWTEIKSGMNIGFRHFDPALMTWNTSGVYDSGILASKKSAYVELSHFSVFAAFDLEPQQSDCYWTLIDVYPRACASPNGTVRDSHPVNCGVASGGTGPVVQDEEAYWEIDETLDAELQAGMSNKLAGMGFSSKVGAKTGKKVGYSKRVQSKKTIPTGADPAYIHREEQPDGTVVETPMTGTVRIRDQMTTMLWHKICNQQVVANKTFDFVTGLCLDVSELSADSACP